MSAKLARQVFESALSPHLKQTAVAMALFADVHGHNIRPALGRVAWMNDVSVRKTRNDVAALVALGVLCAANGEPCPTRYRNHGGRRKPTTFSFNPAKLPAREDWKPGNLSAAFGDGKPGNVIAAFQPTSQPETRQSGKKNPAEWQEKHGNVLAADRSVQIVQLDRSRTAAAPRFSSQAKRPNGTNYQPIAKVVRELLEEQAFETESDLIEATKARCAQLGIDYGRDDAVPFDVVHRACASEAYKFRNGIRTIRPPVQHA